MAIYRLKRKYYGLADAASNTLGAAGNAVKSTVGGVMEGAGKALDTGAGGLAGRIGGAMAGSALGPLGTVAGFILGGKAARGLGKGMKNAGQDMQM
jgi:hypothetical protein